MNPQKHKRDHESVQVKMPLQFTFMHNNDCVHLVIHATIHGNQTVYSWLFHALSFMFIVRE